MEKICVRGENFESLGAALKECGESFFYLEDLILYNVCCRDMLREFGVEGLIELFVSEVPEMAENEDVLKMLRRWASKEELAGYDVQCYGINERVTILGRTFDGLEDIKRHVEISGCHLDRLSSDRRQDVDSYDDVHIGKIYEGYPRFDSYDSADNRYYQNFIFRSEPVKDEDMKEAFRMDRLGNFCMVHERIPEELLPILYYRGEGDYMLLATKKQ